MIEGRSREKRREGEVGAGEFYEARCLGGVIAPINDELDRKYEGAHAARGGTDGAQATLLPAVFRDFFG